LISDQVFGIPQMSQNSRKYRPNVNRSFVQDTPKCVHCGTGDGGNSEPINKTSHILLALEHFSLLRIATHETSREGRHDRKEKGGVKLSFPVFGVNTWD
jgi:hypothetical protein